MYSDLSSGNMTTNSTAECWARCVANPECYGWVVTPSGSCGAVPYCYLKSAMGPQVSNACRISGFVNRSLLPRAFETMSVGTVTPSGWLTDLLTVQANGLTGYLADFWPDIANSSWIGGTGDGGLHERAPYWLNGLVPLSYLTGDPRLAAQRQQFLGYIMAHQQPSGWIGPDDMPTNGDQYWGRFNVILSLEQYFEGSGDPQAITTIFNYLGEARRRMATVSISDWAAARAQDFVMGIFWLVDRFDTLPGVPAGYSQAWLIDLADITIAQQVANGADWKTFFDTEQFVTVPACVNGSYCGLYSHGVNIGQALKSQAVYYRRSQDLTDVASSYIRLDKLDKYHGTPAAIYQADEHLAGNLPSHGTETCAVVESIVSLCEMGAIIGDPYFFERAERVLWNAMPAALTKTMWERVYLQQGNEVFAIEENPHIFYTDGGDAALFSLEGNYGCW
jgi:hypothetical protein